MVKIGPLTAEILLISTNVARTNVAWTNVPSQLESILDVPRNLPLNLVKIGPVTAEILLIWTNVARTNVAWTNIN